MVVIDIAKDFALVHDFLMALLATQIGDATTTSDYGHRDHHFSYE